VRAQRRRPLGARVDDDAGLTVPRPVDGRIGDAAPQVDHRLAVDHDAHRRPELVTLTEVGGERLPHRGEVVVAAAVQSIPIVAIHGIGP